MFRTLSDALSATSQLLHAPGKWDRCYNLCFADKQKTIILGEGEGILLKLSSLLILYPF